MNVLWLTNIALPEASHLLDEKPSPFGGWFVSASTLLAEDNRINLSIAFPKIGLTDIQILKGDKVTYYAFPPINMKDIRADKSYIDLKKIVDQSKPDIVHIFGTEYVHTLAMVNVCKNQKIRSVISIQGLVSIYARHYMASLPASVQNRFNFRDLIKQDNLRQQQRKFIHRGLVEIEALRNVTNIIGRTTWDRACTSQINPEASYYYCNETLRDEFYKQKWNINCCEKYSIFISQASYPIKGLHYMLEAMPMILRSFPDAKLYIGGQKPVKSDNLLNQFKRSSYGMFIKELIKRYKLGENIVFTGILNEQEMCNRYLLSHVFVSPSIIENESNSLSEAKILGVPSVASYVGGVTDRITHGVDGFYYQHDAPYMLAYYVNQIFANNEIAIQISIKARENAMKTNNPKMNLDTLLNIYGKIYSSE
jgi:glycosyltransferase involved in cell wall biosynthesis